MARFVQNGTFKDGSGAAVDAGTITVKLAGTSNAATIYAASSGGSALTGGVVTTGSDGSFTFYIDDGDYAIHQLFDYTLSKTGFTSKTYSDVRIIGLGKAVSVKYVNEYTDLETAVSTIGATVTTLIVTEVEVVANDVTTPTTLHVVCQGLGEFSVNSGKTLTINGAFDAPLKRVFSGSGSIAGLKFLRPEWFGAIVDAGVTDSTTAIQAAMNAMGVGSELHFSSTPGSTYYKVTTALAFIKQNNMVFSGAGRYSTRIKQFTNSVDLFDANTGSSGNTNGTIIRDIWLENAGAAVPNGARYGINAKLMSRSQFQNVQLTGFIGGIYFKDGTIVNIDGCMFGGNQDGLFEASDASISAANGFTITNNTFESQTRYGVNFTSGAGFDIHGNLLQSNQKGGILINQGGHAISINDNYFEANFDGAAGSFDIKLAASSSAAVVNSGTITGNMFGATTDLDHYPIRIGNINAMVIEANTVNNGSHYIEFLNASGTDTILTDSVIGKVFFNNGTANKTITTSASYGNMPNLAINFGSVIEDYETFPSDGQNYIIGDFPFGWATSGSGTFTARRSPDTGSTSDRLNGRPVYKINQTSGSQAQLLLAITTSATVNSRLRGRWVTFLIDVLVNDGSAKTFNMQIASGGPTITEQFSASTATGWKTYAVSHFSHGSTGTLSLFFTALEVADYRLANPRLYVGMNPETMPGLSSAINFLSPAAPSNGTWEQGDFIHNTTPSGGTPTIGFINTVAGTPGTWVSIVAN